MHALVFALDGTKLAQTIFDGLAQGAQYALIVLGFVVIYRATGIINFAQGGLVLVGAYMTYNAVNTWDLPFWPSLLLSMLVTAGVAILIQRAILQTVFREGAAAVFGGLGWAIAQYNGLETPTAFLVGLAVAALAYAATRTVEMRAGLSSFNELPIFGAVMVTIGLLFVIQQVIPSIWSPDNLNLGDPWGIRTIPAVPQQGDLVFSHAKLWTIVLAFVGLGIFFIVDRFTKIGIGMRAVHFDQEAAIAQGIPTGLVFGAAWGIAGAVAALAGTTAAAGSGQLTPSIELVVFLAFPAMILGGFDSPLGAVIGGLLIGIIQNLIKAYVDAEAWGVGIDRVGIFVVMILVLLVRPYGLFGTPEVRRV